MAEGPQAGLALLDRLGGRARRVPPVPRRPRRPPAPRRPPRGRGRRLPPRARARGHGARTRVPGGAIARPGPRVGIRSDGDGTEPSAAPSRRPTPASRSPTRRVTASRSPSSTTAFLALTGYARQEVHRAAAAASSRARRPTRRRSRRSPRRCASGARPPSCCANYRKDGTHFYNELRLAPVLDDDGRLRAGHRRAERRLRARPRAALAPARDAGDRRAGPGARRAARAAARAHARASRRRARASSSRAASSPPRTAWPATSTSSRPARPTPPCSSSAT